jgi:electron transport complex protein RnfD
VSEKYQVSSSPHVRAKDSTSRVMLYVIIALLPATLFGIWNFGMHALLLILVTIASCLASEFLIRSYIKKTACRI